MKINHKLIRTIIQSIGISIFIVSVFFKLKAIIVQGGTIELDPLGPSDDIPNKELPQDEQCDEVYDEEPAEVTQSPGW